VLVQFIWDHQFHLCCYVYDFEDLTKTVFHFSIMRSRTKNVIQIATNI